MLPRRFQLDARIEGDYLSIAQNRYKQIRSVNMDPVRNPYAPGAGTPPPELAGRADVIASGTVALQRVAKGKPTQSLIMVGLRGVGKNRPLEQAERPGRS
jgi:hypothetical protein